MVVGTRLVLVSHDSAVGPHLAVLWFRSRRAWRLERTSSRAFFKRWPTIGRLIHVGRMALFADTLALLLEHDVPMDEAVALATGSSGDRRIRESGQVLAERIRRGEIASTGEDVIGAPPMLGWLLFHHRDRNRLVRSLRRIADSLRRHADWMSLWLSIYLPTWLTIGLGGSLALAYALSGTRATLRNTGAPINTTGRVKGQWNWARDGLEKPRFSYPGGMGGDDRFEMIMSAEDDEPEATSDEGEQGAKGGKPGPVLPIGGFSSPHVGGCLFAFGDGHVSFLSESIDMQTYQQLGHRADGKLLDESAF